MNLPAKTLKDAFNACNPTESLPAGDLRYVDLDKGRGEVGRAVAQCRQQILWSTSPLVQLFAGHRGCGKSTELRRLKSQLEEDGYTVILVEAETDLDLEDTEPTDVLLALLRGFDSALRRAGISVSEELLEEFLEWFAEIVVTKTERKEMEAEASSEAEIGGSVPFFGRLLARVAGRIKTGKESKKDVRRRLDPQISDLLSRIGSYVKAADLAVRNLDSKGLVLIVDSLDRVVLKKMADGRTSHEMLFIERGDLLRSLGCHTILTVPISLLFSAQATNLSAIFPDCYVVPMVKLQDRLKGNRSKAGFDLMRALLASRLDLATLFEDGAADDLIAASGGHPRELLRLVHYSLPIVDETPITREAAAMAIRRLASDFDRSVPESHWHLLAQVHRTKAVHNDATHQAMLFNLSVLEYQNKTRWCDVHPAVQQLDRFQAALKSPAHGKSPD